MFINLHTHDAKASLLDSIIKPEELAEYAFQNKQSAISVTNHGLMTSFVDFAKACKTKEIKPLLGCEIYETDNMYEKADTKDYIQPRYHLIL
jgi:DNA polymerase-3 subunit alpha